MKKLSLILFLFVGMIAQAQIDYKALVRNLEEIGPDTNIREFLKGVPYEEDEYEDGVSVSDERFLRFYGVVVDKMKFAIGGYRNEMSITLFKEESDFELVKAKLIETYGTPETDKGSRRDVFEWKSESKNIRLTAEKEDGKFKESGSLWLTFAKNEK